MRWQLCIIYLLYVYYLLLTNKIYIHVVRPTVRFADVPLSVILMEFEVPQQHLSFFLANITN